MKNSVLPLFLIALMLLCSSPGRSVAAPVPQVVVSVKPVHALVAGVMQGVAVPELLIKGGGSPHGYVLRPSEARALADADLIVWVGPQLESFLEKPLTTLGRDAAQLELLEELRGQLLSAREGGNWEGHEDADEHQHGDGWQPNPHLWLDPLLAKRIVDASVAALSRIDPDRSQLYAANAEQLKTRLGALHGQLERKLAPVRDVPYLVFHDAYQYFEARYRLNAVGSVSVDPERRPGARRILEVREKIKALQARSLFSEPQFEPKLVQTIIEGTDARVGVLDPLGAELKQGPEAYFLLLNRLADSLVAGLQ